MKRNQILFTKGGVTNRVIVLSGNFEDLPKMLKKVREDAGMTQEQVAAKMKIKQEYISQAENGFGNRDITLKILWVRRFLWACRARYRIEII